MAMVRRALLVLVLACAWGAACSSSANDSTLPDGKTGSEAGNDQEDYEDEGEFEMADTRRSRWRWRGERQSCHFLVGNHCFKTRKSACAAAKCRGKHCRTEGDGPAIVSCDRGK